MEKWYTYTATAANDTSPDGRPFEIAALYSNLAARSQVWFAIDRVGSYGRSPIEGIQDDTAPANAGIRLRVPAQGRLLICQKNACQRNSSDDIVAKLDVPISQLGLIYYAGFTSKPFSNGTFELVLDAQGRPKTISYAQTSSTAEVAAGLARDIGGEFATIYNTLNVTESERLAEEIAMLEQESKRLTLISATDPDSPANQLAALEAQKKLEDARRALLLPDTYELERLTVIAEAEKKYADALRALETDPNQNRDEQRAAIEAERLLLEAEALRIEAEIRLRDARNRLLGG
jgi:hypothetical protein